MEILDRTDLQGVPPAGVKVESYLTAFRAGADFVIMRTSSDRSAIRGGMMFSHVFITRVEHIGGLSSLAPVLTALKSERPPTMDVSDFECRDGVVNSNQIHGTPEMIALANALVAKGDRPSIWPDTGDFLKTIDAIWCAAWPELRQKLTFSMALSPDDAHLNDFNIIYIPESEAPRWTGYRIIAKTDRAAQLSAAATALAEGEAAVALRDIAMQVRWPPNELSDLVDLATLGARLGRAVLNCREEIRNLRLLCYLAPAPEAASALKLRIVARAQEAFPQATLEDLLACRNLRLDCLTDVETFWASLRDRVRTLWSTCGRDDDRGSFGDFLIRAEKEQPQSWRRAVEDGLRGAFSASLETRAQDVWNWIGVSPEIAEFLLSLVPETRAAEATLEAALQPVASEATVEQILSALAHRDMPGLRAKCLATYLSPDAAFDWELSETVETPAISSLCKLYSLQVVVGESVRTADSRLIPTAKAAIQSDASLLLDANLDLPGWQLLLKSLRGSAVNFPKGSGFDHIQHQMLAVISCDSPDYDLVLALESLGFFDLSALADRATTWGAIPATMLANFIDASFDGVILRIALGELTIPQLAPQLQTQLRDRLRVMRAIRNMGVGRERYQLELFAALDVLTEDDFLSWYSSLMSTHRPLASDVAQHIGNLIAQRRWKFAAEHVADDVLNYRRSDLTSSLPPIKPLLGIGLRFRLMLAGTLIDTRDFAPHDLWDQLESVLVERFQGGPREHALWSRAQGSDADLLTSGSAREQWHHALRLMRDRTHGSADIELLLNEARKHYYSDPSLSWLHHNWQRFAPAVKGR